MGLVVVLMEESAVWVAVRSMGNRVEREARVSIRLMGRIVEAIVVYGRSGDGWLRSFRVEGVGDCAEV